MPIYPLRKISLRERAVTVRDPLVLRERLTSFPPITGQEKRGIVKKEFSNG
jgi:hypothetical protein